MAIILGHCCRRCPGFGIPWQAFQRLEMPSDLFLFDKIRTMCLIKSRNQIMPFLHPHRHKSEKEKNED
ncbi:MAG: hypothetical protein B6245_18460 [Desulfobacteraceae bacterium 4572_88]|nr:MAG: hypothetical protein B6245_18460 [Desulfobacteraceae bacterium 4572_88]RLC00768.1 MAG: hypothetical protein DRI57_31915 [Deltaproteobacteria bacterium]